MMRPTLHRSLPEELQIMPFNRRLMDLLGIREPKRNLYRFVLVFGWGVFVILLPKLVLGMGSTKSDAITKGFSELLYHGTLFVGTLILALNMTTFERMLQLLSEIIRDVTARDQPRDCYNLIRTQTSRINKFCKFYFWYCCFGPLFFTIPAVTSSYLLYFGSHNDSEPVQFELPMEQEFYGLQIRTNFVHFNIFIACSLPAYFVCATFSMIKVTTLLIVIKYSSLAYQLVTIRIRRLKGPEQIPDTVTFNRSKVHEVVDIVKLHNKALKITDLVEQIVNIPVAMQFVCCVMFWCLVMFYLSKNIDFTLINIMVTFLLSFFETYGFAYLGSELTESAQAVGKAICDLNWYNDSVQLQRYYRLILQRAQRETGVTAAKFFIVGREKFGKIVNMSYSIYLVLKDTLNKM